MGQIDSPLLPSQEADIGRVIGEASLDPNNFEWRVADAAFAGQPGTSVPALVHEPTDSIFIIAEYIDIDPMSGRASETNRRSVAVRPAETTPEDDFYNLEWDDVVSLVEDWLGWVEREMAAPSFQEAARAVSKPASAGSIEEPDQEHFSDEERERLKEELDALRDRIISLEELTETEAEFVREEFEELKDRLRTMEKRAWWKLGLGTMLNLATSGTIEVSTLESAATSLREMVESVGNLPMLAG